MPDTIHAVGMHHLHKFDNGPYEVRPGNSDIAVSNTVVRLINELHKLYSRRPSKSYGKFSDDTVNYPTSIHLREYMDARKNFDELTLAMMAKLAKEAGAKAASTGGHVFFCHFSREEVQYFLVAIVTDKVSAALNENEDLEDVTHLDVDGFRFAGRVNLSGWANNEERYVGFLKGKGAVAEYFKEFLGCDTTIQSMVETRNLVEAIKSFADEKRFQPSRRDEFLARALEICDRDARSDRTIDFQTLANELYPQAPEELTDLLADPDRGLSDGFLANRRALKRFVTFKSKTTNWSVEFDRKALQAGKVLYNSAERSITLFDVPEDMQDELNEEIRDG